MNRFIVILMAVFLFAGCSHGIENADMAKTKATEIPVVFIHGLNGNIHIWDTSSRFFADNGYNEIYKFDYSKTTNETIPNNAKRLWAWLQEQKLTEGPVILVGHSMGGLVARRTIIDHPELNVVKFVTLATPHHGASHTALCTLPVKPYCSDGVLDAKPNSNFLKDLNDRAKFYETPLNVMTFAIKNDEMVSEDSSHIKYVKNITVASDEVPYGGVAIHDSITGKKLVLTELLDFIKEKNNLIKGGPKLRDGKCSSVLPSSSAIGWDLPSNVPAGLEMKIYNLSKPESIDFSASKQVKGKLSKNTYILRFFDLATNASTQWSEVEFKKGALECDAIIKNNPSGIVESWND